MTRSSSTRTIVAAFALLTALSPLVANAAPAYVTDQLRLGFHRAPDTSDNPFRMLQSGEKVEVLERNRFYARVRASDGVEGWVKAGFLMNDRPAVLRVAEVEAKQSELDAELERIAAERESNNQQIASLKANVDEATQRLQLVQAENRSLQQENETFKKRFAIPSVPITWTLGGALFALLAGFFLGLLWVDHRSRKRHGGIRVY